MPILFQKYCYGYLKLFGDFKFFVTVVVVYDCVLYSRSMAVLQHKCCSCETIFVQVEQFGF